MLGYLGNPSATAAVLADGWYVTGDIGAVDDDGFIRLTDRLSRFSKIAGEMVPHLKIEDVVIAALDDPNCVVTAVPDEDRGERLVVFYTKDVPEDEVWAALNDVGPAEVVGAQEGERPSDRDDSRPGHRQGGPARGEATGG